MFLQMIERLAKEPPLRVLARRMLGVTRPSARVRDLWELSPRPQYFAGVLAAAEQARAERVGAITVAEFGVAGGSGLLALEWCARTIGAELGLAIEAVGFDTGVGLPTLCGDHRDHPDHWQPADYPMNEATLRSKLGMGTQLVLGNISETLVEFAARQTRPLGFASLDLDLYSSTAAALGYFRLPGRRTLRRTFLYFDDVDFVVSHRFAGELLAIDEFNADLQGTVKIDVWRGVENGRPFRESSWLKKMYIAHDLAAISAVRLDRQQNTTTCALR